jgi:phage-related protein
MRLSASDFSVVTKAWDCRRESPHQFWYNEIVSSGGDKGPILTVVFYRTAMGNEPVRDWLRDLADDDRRLVSYDIKTAQYGWPLGMPLVRKVEPDLWEVRSKLARGIARVLFSVEDGTMVLLHAFTKKSRKTPINDLRTARRRLADLRGE